MTKELKRIFDGLEPKDIMDLIDRRKKPIQAQIELRLESEAVIMDIKIPMDWQEHIAKLAKKCKCKPEFLYQKAIQGFFDLSPIVWNDDEYLNEWREVYKKEEESGLRPHIQSEDDALTARIIRARNKNLK